MEARLYIHNVDKNPEEATRIAQDAAKRIESRELKLLELVQSIGEHLTDEDTTIRAKAIGYLSTVLSLLGPRSLARQQVPVITQFLCDRIEDETGLKETTMGLTALTKMAHFGKGEATVVATALVKVDLPKHPPSTRFMTLTLVDSLMANHRDALKDMGTAWVTGLADLIGGEKDPRNLMIVFSVMKVILIEFDIVEHVELMFDLVYCYFPITFRPPKDDPYKITAQDLKTRLRECLAATHHFSGQLFPALIEKLDSTTQSVKLDVLQTMSACVLNYGPKTTSTQSTQLWDAVKFEVLTATGDDEIAIEALNVIKSIATSLSTGVRAYPPPNTPLARYLKSIVKECTEILKEPQAKQGKPAGRILAAAATASAPAHSFIIQSSMSCLWLVMEDLDAIAKRRALMEVFNMFMDSTASVYGNWSSVVEAPSINNALDDYKDKLFEIYSQALMGSNRDETSYRLTAMRGLGLLSTLNDFLPDSEIGMVVQYLDEVALELEEKEEVRDEALKILREISTYRGKLIMDITIPAFMARLPDSEEEVDSSKPYHGTLEALAKLSTERPVFEVLLTRLLNKLDVVLHVGTSPDYPRAILSTLLYVLQQRPKTTLEDTKAYYNRLIPRLITRTVVPLVQDQSSVLAGDKVVDITARLLGIILRDLDAELQKSTVDAVFDLLVLNKPSGLVSEQAGLVAQNFHPLDQDSPVEQASCITILAHTLAVVKRDVSLPVDDTLSFLQRIISLSERPKSTAHRFALLRIIGLLVNKWMAQKTDVEALTSVVDELLNSLSSADSATAIGGEKLRIVFWIVKALLLRAEKYGFDVTSKLIDLLGNKEYGSMASRGFGVLLGEDELLKKENHAVVRLLAKQRVFSQCVPKLVEGFKCTAPDTKPNYLIALSNILRNVPSSVIKPELGQLLPLLLQSLDLPEVEVKAATIETLHVTIRESADALKDHADSVITRLLAACTVDKAAGNVVSVRIAALRCLREFPGALRTELLLPYKRTVMTKLLPVLDDPKRTVRKEAVDCRGRWFALDEPEE